MQASGTTFVARPPPIAPTLAVVASSMRHGLHRGGRHGDGRHALLARHARMGGLAKETRLERPVAGRARDHRARGAGGVEHVARGAFRKLAFGERARPQQVHLFARREQHRDVGTFGTRLHHTAHAFQNGRHARLVVGRKDGVANRAHDAVNHCRLDARAGLHGVHVRREHEAARRRARQVRDQVAGVRARLRGRGVEAHLESQIAQLAGAARRHGGLAP